MPTPVCTPEKPGECGVIVRPAATVVARTWPPRLALAATGGRERVAVFQNLDHAAGGLFGLIGLHHRFMPVGIERLVEGVDFLDAEAIENLCQNPVGGGNALDQSVCLSSVPIGGTEGTAQIVDNLKQFAGKVRDRVLLGVLRAPFTLTPGILGLGQRSHQPLTQSSDFGCRLVIIAVARS